MKAKLNYEEKFILAIILKGIIEQDQELILTNNSKSYRVKIADEARIYVQSEMFEADCRLAGVSARYLRTISPHKAQEIYSLLFPSRGRRRQDYKFPEVRDDKTISSLVN